MSLIVQSSFHRNQRFLQPDYEILCNFTLCTSLLIRHPRNLSSFNYTGNFLRLTMYGINEATIIASMAIPAGLFIGFLQSLLIDFVSACNDHIYSSTTKEEIMVRTRWVYWWDSVWSLRSLLINRPTPGSSRTHSTNSGNLFSTPAVISISVIYYFSSHTSKLFFQLKQNISRIVQNPFSL